jgi:hypothetical protein
MILKWDWRTQFGDRRGSGVDRQMGGGFAFTTTILVVVVVVERPKPKQGGNGNENGFSRTITSAAMSACN